MPPPSAHTISRPRASKRNEEVRANMENWTKEMRDETKERQG